jgi:Chalcone isomerase-like
VVRGLILAAVVVLAASVAYAADLESVSMPDARVVDGTQMRLNGIGLRTYSVLGIRIYVAGLYLERRSGDPSTIIHSQQRKLPDIRFLRDVRAEDARRAWLESFEQNCKAPCYLDPRDLQRFLTFTSEGVHVTFNGRLMGDIPDPQFAELMLATFIGAVPPTPRLKRELLGFRD